MGNRTALVHWELRNGSTGPILRTANRRSGSYISSVGIEAKLGMEFVIITDKGSITYRPFQMQILTKLKDQLEEGKWED